MRNIKYRKQIYPEYRSRERTTTRSKFDISWELVNHLFTYDSGKLYWKNPTHSQWLGKEAGSVSGSKSVGFYKSATIGGASFKVHRLIFLLHHRYLPDILDHINGDSLDNRIENLRISNSRANAQNRKLRGTTKSMIKGVTWSARHKGWLVRITVDVNRVILGVYKDLDVAAKIYKDTCIEFYGEWRQ